MEYSSGDEFAGKSLVTFPSHRKPFYGTMKEENIVVTKEFLLKERPGHIFNLWYNLFLKMRGCVTVMIAFDVLNKTMFLEGSKKSKLYFDPSKNKKRCIVVMPQNKVRRTWETWIHIILLYTALYVPFKIGFNPPDSENMKRFDYCVDASFILDFFLQFIFAF